MLLAFWLILPHPNLGAREKAEGGPESLPGILREGADALGQELTTLKGALEAAQQELRAAAQELQEVRAQVATLKASVAVKELSLNQAQEAQESLGSKIQSLPPRLKELEQKRSDLARQEASRRQGFAALEKEIRGLEAAKHPIWRHPDVRRAYQRFRQLSEQYFATITRLQELLDKRYQLLVEEQQLLTELQGQLQHYLEEVWKTELLKRQAPVPWRQRLTQTWTAFSELPARFHQYLGQLWTSGELSRLLWDKAAPLLGLLALFSLLLWGAHRVRRLLLPRLKQWQVQEAEPGPRTVLETGIILFTHLYLLSLFLWLLLALWTLDLWGTRGGGLILLALGVWTTLRLGRRLIQALFAGEGQGGLLPLDPQTARFYRRHFQCLLAFVLLLGILGLNAARLLEVEPESRRILGEILQVGLLFWASWLLRPRWLDPLRLELPGPAWMRRRGFFLGVRALVLLALGVILFFSLLGFHNLSAYVAAGSALTGLTVILFWLGWQGLRTLLRYVLHPEQGRLAKSYPASREFLPSYYRLAKRGAVVLLTLTAGVVILKVWGVPFRYLAQGLFWLNRGPSLGPLNLTPLNLASAALALYLGHWFSRALQSLLELRFYPRTDWDQGIRYTISTTCHYAILLLALLLALNFLGFPLTNLALVAGALGVGIGFGLQNIVNNFVSGLILLFERPIKVGDLLVIDGQWGRVREIRVRSTTFETVDRAVIIIPNSELLAHKITNWTRYGRRPSRLTLEVGVSYRADVHLVTRLLRDLCANHPRVLKEPPPQVYFQAFGDSALTFTIRVFVKSPEPQERQAVTHELNAAIHAAFREHGIEIPFPQRDLHLKSWPGPLVPARPPSEER